MPIRRCRFRKAFAEKSCDAGKFPRTFLRVGSFLDDSDKIELMASGQGKLCPQCLDGVALAYFRDEHCFKCQRKMKLEEDRRAKRPRLDLLSVRVGEIPDEETRAASPERVSHGVP